MGPSTKRVDDLAARSHCNWLTFTLWWLSMDIGRFEREYSWDRMLLQQNAILYQRNCQPFSGYVRLSNPVSPQLLDTSSKTRD